jgi:hypothetical protein
MVRWVTFAAFVALIGLGWLVFELTNVQPVNADRIPATRAGVVTPPQDSQRPFFRESGSDQAGRSFIIDVDRIVEDVRFQRQGLSANRIIELFIEVNDMLEEAGVEGAKAWHLFHELRYSAFIAPKVVRTEVMRLLESAASKHAAAEAGRNTYYDAKQKPAGLEAEDVTQTLENDVRLAANQIQVPKVDYVDLRGRAEALVEEAKSVRE